MNKAIICIDDERIILDSLKTQLKKGLGKEFTIEVCDSALEGLEIIDELMSDNTEVLLIISDWLMPGMKGDEFLAKAHSKYPNIIKIMLTGQADRKAIEHAKEKANLYALVKKPWNENELAQLIKKSIKDLNEKASNHIR
ncbi:MAG: DNA-binding NtrC family response regulator [Saprospiraceae bacterium]|jgi:DNA-binding NtrC family response regulator